MKMNIFTNKKRKIEGIYLHYKIVSLRTFSLIDILYLFVYVGIFRSNAIHFDKNIVRE